MKLVAEIDYPGWRLRNWLNEKAHWAVRWKASKPKLEVPIFRGRNCWVKAPHKRRLVEITRFGPRTMDEDGLAASIKPVLDRIKAGAMLSGLVYDDSPKYVKLVVRQEKTRADGLRYGATVRVYEFP